MKRLRVMLLMFAGLAGGGCVPLVVGGAAVGGYYVGQDEREPAVIASDSRITATVKSKLIGDKYVDGFRIGVETWEGVVTLHGEVGSSIPREQAERLAASVDGVKSVRNEIRIVREPAQDSASR
jgi:hyperosmotically inducible periplasmic protein